MTGIFESIFGDSGKRAEKATLAAAGVAAESQTEALDFLREREAVPQKLRDEALTGLGGLFGTGGEEITQQSLIDKARNSPLFKAIMGGRASGEESIARFASASGGFRSGNLQENLGRFGTELENEALLQSFNQELSGLQGLAGLPSNAPQIAQSIAGIGQTRAMGITGGAQARETGRSQTRGNILGLASLGLTGFDVGGFSDIRLKENIVHIGEQNGFYVYSWDWNEAANVIGLEGSSEGYMAHEIFPVRPDAIGSDKGYITIDYDMLEAA